MSQMWNQRYQTPEFVYGKEPNEFFWRQLNKLEPGRILLAGEGEGRNAIYAAKQGWDVTAFDLSEVAKHKALAYALEENVTVQYDVKSVMDIDYPFETFDCVAAIFMHLPKEIKREAIMKLATKLKHGGTLLIEVFSEKQLNNSSGGPKDIDMLFAKNEFEEWFKSFHSLEIVQDEIELNEGLFHRGKADTIRLIGTK